MTVKSSRNQVIDRAETISSPPTQKSAVGSISTRILLVVALALICMFQAFAGKVVKNPIVEFQKTGIEYVTQIELTDTATLLTIETKFIPHWWVKFSKTDYLEDCATGDKYLMKGLIGGEMGAEIYMGDSGDSSFVCIFEPLKPIVTKFDHSDGIYGISLTSKAKTKAVKQTSTELESWLEGKMQEFPQSAELDLSSPNFFNADTARLFGYLKGYDPRAGFTTAIIYVSDELTRKDYPVNVIFQEDGRFECKFTLQYPKYLNLVFNRTWMPVYFEPGKTVGLVLDWEDFLMANRYRNAPYQFKLTSFEGPLAKVNKELAAFPFSPYDDLRKKIETMSPEEFSADRCKAWDAAIAEYDAYLAVNHLSNKAKAILKSQIDLKYGEQILDYVMHKEMKASYEKPAGPRTNTVPTSYFSFLQRIDLDNPALLTGSQFSVFINRYEYMQPFTAVDRRPQSTELPKPTKSLYRFLKDENVQLTPEVDAYMARGENLSLEETKELPVDTAIVKQINEKYLDKIKEWSKTCFPGQSDEGRANNQAEKWSQKKSMLEDSLNLQAGLTFQVAKVRSLRFQFGFMGKDASAIYWEKLKPGIPQPFLIAVGDALYAELFPDGPVAAAVIPSGKAGDVFRKIIEPHKGKILFVDFWATTCGPCVGGIKSMKETRAAHLGDPDIDFVFITDERSSPQTDYDKFVDEQEMVNTYRLNTDDYNLLRELFRFNGIPRYVVIDKQGRVLNGNFQMHNFASELPGILAKTKDI